MTDFTISLDDTTAALTSAAFQEKFGGEATPAAVMLQLAAYMQSILDEYVDKHALMDAQLAATATKATAQAAITKAFTLPAPVAVTITPPTPITPVPNTPTTAGTVSA